MMFKSRGLRLVLKYFFEAHLYDIRNRTDTATMKVIDFSAENKGVMTWKSSDYMVSWTSIVSKIFTAVSDYDPKALEFRFCDVGSGKGKVLLVWAEKLREEKIESQLIGIEIDESLNFICAENFRKRNFKLPQLYSNNFCNLIDGVYLIVYVNPVHHEVIMDSNMVIFSSTGWHPNMNFYVYAPKNYL